MTAQIPGFGWLPANRSHFTAGRSERIRGAAQHYTAGTDSRAWLTWQSGQDDPSERVSSTFLVRKNATIADRGWQLVRIEDTAWTTAFANPYTVSIEYEHRQGQPIPDEDYRVLAQTWVDVARYVTDHQLGEIPLNRSGIRGHKEWVGNNETVCPDGIDLDRIVSEIQRILQNQPHPAPTVRYFEATGHYLGHGFKGYWESLDNPRLHGAPISEEFDMELPGAGVATVQYFERARYQFQPNQADNEFGVVLGNLGAEAIAGLDDRFVDFFAPRPGPGSSDIPLVSLESWFIVRDPNDVPASKIVDLCFKHGRSPRYGREKIQEIADSIVRRTREFGFRTSIAAAQMLHETGFFQFGGQVSPEQNNFAGLGATNDGAAGASFPSVEDGVLAVMCHQALYAYGDFDQWPQHLRVHSNRAIRRDAVHWAHHNVRKPNGELLGFFGSVQRIQDFLNGRWARTDSVPLGTLENGYARALVRVANEIIES